MKLAYTSVAAPRFATADGTMIDCLVVFPAVSLEPVPFTSAQVDPGAEHSEEIFARCLAGEFGPVAPWEEIQPVAEVQSRMSGHVPAKRKPAAPAKKREKLGPPHPPVLVKKRKPPAPAKPPKRKR